MAGCHAHPFEGASATCRTCHHDFCEECVVYSYGPSKPPFCIPCAIKAAGVRSTAGRTPAAASGPRRFGRRRSASPAPEPAQDTAVERVAEPVMGHLSPEMRF